MRVNVVTNLFALLAKDGVVLFLKVAPNQIAAKTVQFDSGVIGAGKATIT